jgi:alpha-tubulin suppressor-like RCC1 family protein
VPYAAKLPLEVSTVVKPRPQAVKTSLFAVGMNDDGQLGIPNTESGYSCTIMFRKVKMLLEPLFKKICCGSMCVMALSHDGEV